MKNRFLPIRTSKARCCIILLMMMSLYLSNNISIVLIKDNGVFTYVVKPILWLVLTIIVWRFPKINCQGKLRHRGLINAWAFNFAIIFIIINFVAGKIDGFCKSEYSHTLTGMMFNVLLVGSMLIGTELSRSYLVNSFKKRDNFLWIIVISLITTIFALSFDNMLHLKTTLDKVQYITQYFGPEFSKNIMASYLVSIGGPTPSIIYLGIMQAFNCLSPVLPDLKWITTGLVGILCPIFSLMIMQSIYLNVTNKIKIADKADENPLGWIIVSIVSIGIIWFCVGVFKIFPSVIATGSMRPNIYPGDIVLVERESTDALKKGDIIYFKFNDIFISHRIINIKRNKNEIAYETKGDHNTMPDDDYVKPKQIMGKVIKVIPKIGWPTLLFRLKKDTPLEKVEF